MNKVLELLKERERSKLWLAKKMVISHQSLDYKIEHDTFTPEQKIDAARWLGVTVADLFPETVQEVVLS